MKTDISSCPPSKNVHSPSLEGGLTSDHVFHRSAKPSTLGTGDKKETEADAERAVRNDRIPEVESNEEEEKENWREPVTKQATTEKRKHLQNYQADNGMTPLARVLTKAYSSEAYSSVRHPYSQSSSDRESSQPFLATDLIQTSPQAPEFYPSSCTSASTAFSSSANPSTTYTQMSRIESKEEKENWCEPVTERATTEKRKHLQNYQAGNGMTPLARVLTKAHSSEAYSSVRHPYSQPSPERESGQPFLATDLIQTSPQAWEFYPPCTSTSTAFSSSVNPSTTYTQMYLPQRQQSYQANVITPFARVFRKRPTKAQLYSSGNHPLQSTPEDDSHQLCPAADPIQTRPQGFDLYSLYTSTSSSANPSIHTSMSPTIQPPEVHTSGNFFTGTPQQGRRASLGNEFGVFQTAPMRSNSITPSAVEPPINVRPRHQKNATMPAPSDVFMRPPVYSLTRPSSPTGFSQVIDFCPCCRIDTHIIGIQPMGQPASPQGLPSLYPSVVAPWMVGGSTNHPAVPASISPNCVVARPVQNVVRKALPQPEVREQRRIGAARKSTMKSSFKAIMSLSMFHE